MAVACCSPPESVPARPEARLEVGEGVEHARDGPVAAAAGHAAEQQVLLDAHVGEQAPALGDERDA